MVYAKGFFDLQIQFADKVAKLSGIPLPRALLEYTNLYVRFGLNRDFHSEHPTWQAFLAGLEDAHDRLEWTYRFYLSRADVMAGPPIVATFGCFSYALIHGDCIRLHFQNSDTEGHSSLDVACFRQRRDDLTALFRHVQRTQDERVQVVGASWLYNLAAYRRLFPASYVATARVIPDRFQSMPLWGQFLDRHGDTKERMTRPFLERLKRTMSVEQLHECFPFQVLRVQTPVREFCDFYGI